MAKSSRLFGLVWITLAACWHGNMALFARLAYSDGVDTTSLLALRFALAALVLGAAVGLALALARAPASPCVS